MFDLIFKKDDYFFLKKILASTPEAPQEMEAKFRLASHLRGIQRFYVNFEIARCQTTATLLCDNNHNSLKPN